MEEDFRLVLLRSRDIVRKNSEYRIVIELL